ncbi:MAG: PAS domain S-box protein [Candidatus Hodarchaeales archaeon]|jgi:PAS domain S-box-containing protein
MGIAELEHILQRVDVPSDVKDLVKGHLDEIKKNEEALRKSETKLRAILGAIPDLIFQISEDGTYLSYKGAKEDLFSAPEEFLGKKIVEVMPKEIAEQTMPYIERTQQTGELQTMTFQIPIAGKNRDFESRMVPCDEGEVLAIIREITTEKALRETEERLRLFMDAVTDTSFIIFDSELNIVEINKTGLRRFEEIGLKMKDIIGENLSNLSLDLKESGRFDKYMEVIRTDEPFHVEDFIPHPRYGELHADLKAYKVGDGLGIITTDITERKKTERTLRE